MDYFVNKEGANTVPYKTVTTGAHTISQIINECVLNDGDNIYVIGNGDAVKNTFNEFNISNIQYAVNIIGMPVGSTLPIVKVKDTSVNPFILNCDNITVRKIIFEKIDSQISGGVGVGSVIKCVGDNIVIEECEVKYDEFSTSETSSCIEVENSNGVIIKNTNIITLRRPDNDTSTSTGILLRNCNKCDIIGNDIRLENGISYGVGVVGNSNYNNIEFNNIHAYTLVSDGMHHNKGIIINGNNNLSKIHRNVISIYGESIGVQYIRNDSIPTLDISHNVVVIHTPSSSSTGVSISYKDDDAVFNVYNNIIYDSFTDIIENTSVAFNVSCNFGFVDYNCVYGFSQPNIFIGLGSIRYGSKNIIDYPFTNQITPKQIPSMSDFKISINSSAVGSGYGFYDMGIDKINGVNFIDSVLYSVDNIINKNNINNRVTFFNNVIGNSCVQLNKIRSLTYNGYCVTPNIYRNQFDFVFPTFPFTVQSDLYNKSFDYIMENKMKLSPFSGMMCPANPGYGAPTYNNYENGLWGYSRSLYTNECGGSELECIIQDSYTSNEIIQDVNTGLFIIRDKVNPVC